MFQNKSSTMPLRTRIPTRRTAAITDENKVGVATRSMKDGEPIKAALKNNANTAVSNASAIPSKSHTGHVKTFGANANGIATRTRSALGEINKHTHDNTTKIVKPGEIAAKIHSKPSTKSGRVALGVSSKSIAGLRARQLNVRGTAANRTSSTVLGARPISKPSSTFGARRGRAAGIGSLGSSVATTGTKRAKAGTAIGDEAIASQLGKHTRSGRIARPAARVIGDTESAKTIDTGIDGDMETEDVGVEAEESKVSTASCHASARSHISSSSSTLVSSGCSSTKDHRSPGDSASTHDELKFVDVDATDYALSHVGLSNETPITMEEINAFEADVDPSDMTLIPEFSDDIFGYMRELEHKLMPDPNYMDHQPALEWSMRPILVDWLVQVHHRFCLLPETLYLCINFVDRFLSAKEVPVEKLQLVGAVSLLLASKYEEIHVPSIKDMVYMVEKTYKEAEILASERYLLRMLNFDLGWPGPLSFLRRISKADDYDVPIRTLTKYLMEVTLTDERFISVPPSKVAATAYYLAIRFLNKGPWTRAHAFYSGYFESELISTAEILIQILAHPKRHRAIFQKYNDRRLLLASEYVYQWFQFHDGAELVVPTNGDHSPDSVPLAFD